MHLRDHTEAFIEHVIGHDDESGYEAKYPELFEHYFRFFGARHGYSKNLTGDDVREMRDRIKEQLPDIEERFACSGFDLDDIHVVLFVGQNSSNGHALFFHTWPLVWLPVETYHSSHAVSVFVPHEIVHALHYGKSRSFFFSDEEQRSHQGRQLLTEGIATLLSGEIAGVDDTTALWADYVSRDWAEAWVQRRKDGIERLAEHALKTFDTSPRDNSLFWFTGLTDDNILQNRSGYFLGMRIARTLRERYGFGSLDLVRTERGQMETLAKKILQTMMR